MVSLADIILLVPEAIFIKIFLIRLELNGTELLNGLILIIVETVI